MKRERTQGSAETSFAASVERVNATFGQTLKRLAGEIRATRAWLDEEKVWVELSDGRELGIPLSWFPRILSATAEQRMSFFISGDGEGLHWDDIDEDISVRGLLMGIRLDQNAAGLE